MVRCGGFTSREASEYEEYNRQRSNRRHECQLAVAFFQHLAIWSTFDTGAKYPNFKPGDGRASGYFALRREQVCKRLEKEW